MHKINSSCKIQIEHQKVIVEMRQSLMIRVLSGVSTVLIFLGFLFLLNVKEKDSWPVILGFAMLAWFFLLNIHSMGHTEHSEIDLSGRMVTKTQIFFLIHYGKSIITWPEVYRFKYSIEYDNYKEIDRIWLTVYSAGSNESWQLIRFSDKETFLYFQKIFNGHFPQNQIMEWHD